MNRAEILEAAKRCVCGEREGEYGTPERNFDTIARLWTVYLNARVPDNGFRGTLLVTPKDVAMMMALLKVARISASDKAAALISEKAAEYEALQSSAAAAAGRGYVDDIIKADETRQRVIAAFEMLFTKREGRPSRKHGTV